MARLHNIVLSVSKLLCIHARGSDCDHRPGRLSTNERPGSGGGDQSEGGESVTKLCLGIGDNCSLTNWNWHERRQETISASEALINTASCPQWLGKYKRLNCQREKCVKLLIPGHTIELSQIEIWEGQWVLKAWWATFFRSVNICPCDNDDVVFECVACFHVVMMIIMLWPVPGYLWQSPDHVCCALHPELHPASLWPALINQKQPEIFSLTKLLRPLGP